MGGHLAPTRVPAFLNPLEEGIQGVQPSMPEGTDVFGRDGLPFMDLAGTYCEAIPFHSLLKPINETHRRGLDLEV